MVETLESIGDWLEQNGWTRGHLGTLDKCDRLWHKRFPSAKPGCFGNDGKPLQLSVNGYDFQNTPAGQASFSVDLYAECDDGNWIHYKSYGIYADQAKDKIDAQCQKLIRAWQASQNLAYS